MKGIGQIKVYLEDGIERTLKDVKYVPQLRKNLISLGVLDSLRYSVRIEKGLMKVISGSLVALKEKKVNGLYILLGNVSKDRGNVASI